MRFLDSSSVLQALTPHASLASVARALSLQARGEYSMPDRLSLAGDSEASCLLVMPCQADGHFCTKLVTVMPANPAQGRPLLDGMILLSDAASGERLALLDGPTLTSLRTGAVGGLAVGELAPQDASTLMIAGCGVQGRQLARHSCTAHPFARVLLCDRTLSKAESLAEQLAPEFPEVQFEGRDAVDPAAAESQVLITATTARQPVFADDPALFEGKLCIAMGSFEADVREFPHAAFADCAAVFVDTPHALVESGELATPLEQGLICADQIGVLGQAEARRAGDQGGIFFKSVGMALFDLCASQQALHGAEQQAAGVQLP